jgi:hypothetical protein
VHYRVCPHRGQPHYRPDEPCVWMSWKALHAFLTWAVQKGYIRPSWVQACLTHEGLQAASALTDAAAAGGDARPERSGGLVGLIRRYPLPALLVGLGVGLLLGHRRRAHAAAGGDVAGAPRTYSPNITPLLPIVVTPHRRSRIPSWSLDHDLERRRDDDRAVATAATVPMISGATVLDRSSVR